MGVLTLLFNGLKQSSFVYFYEEPPWINKKKYEKVNLLKIYRTFFLLTRSYFEKKFNYFFKKYGLVELFYQTSVYRLWNVIA